MSRRQEVDHRQAADLLSKMDSFLESFLVSTHVIAAVQVMLIVDSWVLGYSIQVVQAVTFKRLPQLEVTIRP